MEYIELVDKLCNNHTLSDEEYLKLLEDDSDSETYLMDRACEARKSVYGNDVYIRGLIEISNYCKNNCLYCGIRRDGNVSRYRLNKDQIMACVRVGYDIGFRTFVLQGGEDVYYTDVVLEDIISHIRNEYPDCAITLSLGERSFESYKRLYDAGADRYLLRHETADCSHYGILHPKEMSYNNRMECLRNLKKIGYQTGCGMMVGSPGQTVRMLIKDIRFIEEFEPHMVGIGPYIPHGDTPFRDMPSGDVRMTIRLLSIIRLINPGVLLPATTALASLAGDGREQGILAGANVVMPNLSPIEFRERYTLYNNKADSGAEAAEGVEELRQRMNNIGYNVVVARGDYIGRK